MLDLESQKGVHEKPPPLDDSNHLMRPRLQAICFTFLFLWDGWDHLTKEIVVYGKLIP